LFNIKDKLRTLFKALLTALLFSTQTVFHYGAFISVMITPLLFYLPILVNFAMTGDQRFEIYLLSFVPFYYGISLGQVVSCIGLIVFCIASIQWIWYRYKKANIFTKGIYAKIRHPQFLGIIVLTLGLTIEVLTSGLNGYVTPFNQGGHSTHLGLPQLVGLWVLQVSGYVAIALYEERHMSKDFAGYREYKQKVPFLFPVKNPNAIPEALFTFLLIAMICAILFLLPYNLLYVNFTR
jgi:protein-S-isoprenylcysteine O-methyltransferase Ste14